MLIPFFVLVLMTSVFAQVLVLNSGSAVAPGASLSGYSLSFTNTATGTYTNVVVRATLTGAPTQNLGSAFSIESGASRELSLSSLILPSNARAGNTDLRVEYTGKDASGNDITGSEVFSVIVAESGSLTFNPRTLEFSLLEEETETQTFQLTSTANFNLNGLELRYEGSTLEDDDDDVISLFVDGLRLDKDIVLSLNDLAASTQRSHSVRVDVEKGVDIGSYTGTLKVFRSGQELASLSLNVFVEPDVAVCVEGVQGDRVSMTLEKPEDDEEFFPGDLIDFEVEVDNEGDSDESFTLEAHIYNVDSGSRIGNAYKATKRINDGDTEVFTFEMTLPSNLDEDDEYVVYLKAFERNEEETQCVQERLSLEIDVREDHVVLDEVSLSSLSVRAGSTTYILANVVNIGSDNNPVRVVVEADELGLSEESEVFTLEANEDSNTQLVRVPLSIPSNAAPGTYDIIVYAEYASNEVTVKDHLSLIVTGGNSGTGLSGESELNLDAGSTDTGTSRGSSSSGTNSATGKSVFDTRAVIDALNSGFNVPGLVWVLIDVLLFVGILAVLISLFRKRR